MIYCSLDLEMEQPSGRIISVGIAMLSDATDFNYAEDFMITPDAPLSDFIKGLTGLDDSMYDWNKSRQQCYQDMLNKIDSVMASTAEKFSHEWITWGQGDVSTLRQEIHLYRDRIGEQTIFPRRCTDVKTLVLFEKHVAGQTSSSRMGLKTALAQYGLKFEGHTHRSIDDAKMTLQLFLSLLCKRRVIRSSIKTAGGLL